MFILGTPLHSNLGDQAIACAETDFIHSNFPAARTITIPMSIFTQATENTLHALIDSRDILIGHGGGNMGEMYIAEELCRRKIIQLFPKNKIIIFPQTIHYGETRVGRIEVKKSKKIYSLHKRLTLIAREQTSYNRMQQIFRNNSIILTPDIVLSTSQSNIKLPRAGVLICLREDIEGKLQQQDKQDILDFAMSRFSKVTYTDTVSKAKLFSLHSKRRAVQGKLDEFKSAKLVITDRLHGMVFSAITGTPCIAMSNFNHKVGDTYKWISYLPYIQFCSSTNDLYESYKMINLEQAYSYDPAYFKSYWDRIKATMISLNHGR